MQVETGRRNRTQGSGEIPGASSKASFTPVEYFVSAATFRIGNSWAARRWRIGSHDTRQQSAIAPVGKIGLYVADDTAALVHRHATEIVEVLGLPRLNEDANAGVGRAVVRLMA